MSDDVSKSWFCVFNNPSEHGYDGTPAEIVDRLLNEWVDGHPTRTCAAAFCISKDGLPHIHIVLEDTKAMRFTSVKKTFPSMHIEPTKGNKNQAEDYIKKRGRFEEKGEQVIYVNQIGEIKGSQGSRRDLEIIEELILQGKTPCEIMDMSFSYRRYEKMIKDAYFAKRNKETPFVRSVTVVYHVGESGSGKTFVANKIVEKHGEDSLYFVNDYQNGGMDLYNGQPFLFMDEFRGQIPFFQLLAWLDCYKVQIHARFSNAYSLWNEVHISTVLPPENLYSNMVLENRDIDTKAQLFRRISTIVYHWKENDSYHSFSLPMKEYIDFKDLKNRAQGVYDFHNATAQEQLVFK